MKTKEEKIADLLSENFSPYLHAKVNNKDISYNISLLPELKLNNVNEEDIQKVIKEFETCKSQLMQQTDDEIKASWSKMQEIKEIKNQEYLKERELKKQRHEQNLFFNKQSANADYDHWSKLPYNQDEAVALLLGKCPDVVNWDNIEYQARDHPFAKQYARLREIINRALESEELKHRKIPSPYYSLDFSLQIKPSDLIEWANSRGIEVPIELKEKVMHGFKDWKSLYDEKCIELGQLQEKAQYQAEELEKALSNPHAKEWDSVLKMIFIMSSTWGYFHGKKNEAAKNICTELADRKIKMDEGVARKFLKLAGDSHTRVSCTEDS